MLFENASFLYYPLAEMRLAESGCVSKLSSPGPPSNAVAAVAAPLSLYSAGTFR